MIAFVFLVMRFSTSFGSTLTVRAQLARAVGDRVVVRGDHPALAGRDDLARVEREDGLVRIAPDLASLVLRRPLACSVSPDC